MGWCGWSAQGPAIRGGGRGARPESPRALLPRPLKCRGCSVLLQAPAAPSLNQGDGTCRPAGCSRPPASARLLSRLLPSLCPGSARLSPRALSVTQPPDYFRLQEPDRGQVRHVLGLSQQEQVCPSAKAQQGEEGVQRDLSVARWVWPNPVARLQGPRPPQGRGGPSPGGHSQATGSGQKAQWPPRGPQPVPTAHHCYSSAGAGPSPHVQRTPFASIRVPRPVSTVGASQHTVQPGLCLSCLPLESKLREGRQLASVPGGSHHQSRHPVYSRRSVNTCGSHLLSPGPSAQSTERQARDPASLSLPS